MPLRQPIAKERLVCSMPAPSYTITLLKDTVASSGGATLLDSYDTCNATTTIRFKCKCGIDHEKKMRSVIDKGGLICKACSKKIMVEKTKQTNLERYGVENSCFLPEVKAKKRSNNAC